MKTNYHSHTYICGHSTNNLEELVIKAIENGYDKFGISEHLPLPYNPIRKPTIDQLISLIDEVNVLKEKYKKDIKIFMGVECEYYPDGYLDKWVNEVKNIKGIDYINFGNHFYDSCYKKFIYYHHYSKHEIIERYKFITEHALKSKLFVGYNHPDIFIRDVKDWNQETKDLTKFIAEQSIKNNVPLEFNLNGLAIRYDLYAILEYFNIKEIRDWKKIKKQKITEILENKFLDVNKVYIYPFPNFWKELKGSKVKINIGLDTHSMELMNDHYFQLALHLISEWGLKKNLVNDLKIK